MIYIYKSRLIIVNRVDFGDYVFAEKIAEFNLCSMPWNHKKIFTTPIDFNIYVNDEATKIDYYGKHCFMADVQTVIEELEWLDKYGHNRRYQPLIGLLKGFDLSEWDDLKIVHYGY